MATSARPSRRTRRRTTDLDTLIMTALDDMKAVNIKKLDVSTLTDVADVMFVASGNSDRHVRAIAEHVVEAARAAGRRPFGVEGKRDSDWVLVDLQDALVHVMLPRAREFYALEQLWEAPASRTGKAAGKTAGRPVRKPKPPGKTTSVKAKSGRSATGRARARRPSAAP